jgi:hypothetical protein
MWIFTDFCLRIQKQGVTETIEKYFFQNYLNMNNVRTIKNILLEAGAFKQHR